MNLLVKAELLRLVSRRLLVVLLVGMAALAAFVAAVSADGVRPLNAQDYRSAQHSLESEKEYWEEECATGSAASADICADWGAPTKLEDFLRTPNGFGTYTEDAVTIGLPIMLLAAAILAASLVGGEFSSGNIGTQLLFTPRRVPLFVSKVAAATLGGLLVVITYLGTTLALSAIMFLSLRGADAMAADVGLAVVVGRAMVLAFLIAVMAGALAMAAGSTLITAGIFAVVLLGSSMLSDAISGYSLSQPFLPSNIFWAMLQGEHHVFGNMVSVYDDWGVAQVIHYDWALTYSVIGTVLILVVSAWWFRRRDILG